MDLFHPTYTEPVRVPAGDQQKQKHLYYASLSVTYVENELTLVELTADVLFNWNQLYVWLNWIFYFIFCKVPWHYINCEFVAI